MNILIFLILVFVFLMIFFLFVFHNFFLSIFLFEWEFLGLKFNFFFNSLVFSVVLLVISLSVLIFSTYYLNKELNFGYYLLVLLIFIGSMFMLNFSNGVFSMMLSWDLLGISSFFLVLFYSNWDSNSGAMNTALTNRIGDYFMFCFFSGLFFGCYFFFSITMLGGIGLLMLLLSSFTKSAQFPFSSWLPKAMSAPTPVSSLVHSSTLVTAGLILLMNFDLFIMNLYGMKLLLVVGIFTMMFSSVSAMCEEDMKKVVALSTLSQMGFMMFTLGLGMHFVSFVHLLSHALFKSCLFMQVGYMIHKNYSQQDGRFYGNNGSFSMLIQLQLLITLFCLCGLFFTSGMVSKDLILEFFFFNNVYFWLGIFFIFSVFLTFAYSYRLWKSFFLTFSKMVNEIKDSYMMNFLSILLVFLSIFFISWMNVNMIGMPSLFVYFDFYLPLFYMMMLIVLFFFLLKLILKELVYKFFVDYFSCYLLKFGKNYKWLDLGLMKIGNNFYYLFMMTGKMKGLYLNSLGFNSVVVLILLLFIIL
uniref:NADH dehydrogenase subunit 5 n=1 Tax=Varestrongylus eleguneniensis TaxID=1258553 RepID=UPI00226CF6AE|nr:NADH dehydrogenase subunit 5 [Varestrongylus eleguneniensis]UZM11412.1 NADH dehydrogenase subunit 5 [Varestrongylus eleguneniensis]